jgi:hypothetical protein
MKHIGIALAAILMWSGSMFLLIQWDVERNDERVADINAAYGERCVPFPPYERAKVVRYLEQNGLGGRNQFQLAVRTRAGDEEAVFVPAEAILPLTPLPCGS